VGIDLLVEVLTGTSSKPPRKRSGSLYLHGMDRVKELQTHPSL
jgi:hypothetical protein